jgi:hypothetical protein
MTNGQREYRVTFAVAAAPHEAARLRTVLRECLELEGFALTAGVVTAERWLLDAMAIPPTPFRDSRGVPEAEHVGKTRKRTSGPRD